MRSRPLGIRASPSLVFAAVVVIGLKDVFDWQFLDYRNLATEDLVRMLSAMSGVASLSKGRETDSTTR